MPRGIYERKPREPKPEQPEAPPAAPDERRRRRHKRDGKALPAIARKAGAAAPLTALLDIRRGTVTLNASKGSLELEPDELGALASFFRGKHTP